MTFITINLAKEDIVYEVNNRIKKIFIKYSHNYAITQSDYHINNYEYQFSQQIVDLDNNNSIQLVKFMLIGLSGVIVNFIILHISLYFLSEKISVLLAIYISMSTNYIFNRIWTFKSKGKIFFEYTKYLASAVIGALIQYLITINLAIYLRSIDLDKLSIPFIDIPIIYITTLVGVGFGFMANFLLSKKFVFI